jgi:hypothetical protein
LAEKVTGTGRLAGPNNAPERPVAQASGGQSLRSDSTQYDERDGDRDENGAWRVPSAGQSNNEEMCN